MKELARAMSITKLSEDLTTSDVDTILAKFGDNKNTSNYAKLSSVQCISAGLIYGQTATTLAPQSYITRAEVAVIVERLL